RLALDVGRWKFDVRCWMLDGGIQAGSAWSAYLAVPSAFPGSTPSTFCCSDAPTLTDPADSALPAQPVSSRAPPTNPSPSSPSSASPPPFQPPPGMLPKPLRPRS